MDSGEPPARRARLIDVARAAGVSTATVSRALSGRQGVSRAQAERIQRLAAELGYIVNEHARTLASGASRTVGLIVHEINDPYFSEIAGGVLAEAEEHGLTVHIAHTRRDPEDEVHEARVLIANGVRAIIVAGSGLTGRDHRGELTQVLHRFTQLGGNVSLIGRHEFDGASVEADNYAAGQLIGSHVLDLGHRRIGIIRGDRELTTICDRMTGIFDIFDQRGLAPDRIPVAFGAFHRSGGIEATVGLLDAHPDLTAIIALNDAMAIGALSTLKSRGLRVPQDISVTGFNDIAVARDLSPGLTTVRLPLEEMGRIALRNAVSSTHTRVLIDHRLVVRDSTAPVSG